MKREKAFTLIELLVIIAIIGLLSTIILVSLNRARGKSRDTKRISDLKQVQTALELLYDNWQVYPGNAADTPTTCDCRYYEGGQGGCTLWYYLTVNGLIEAMPRDPLMDPVCFGQAWSCATDGWAYRYNYINSGEDYELSAKLEVNTDLMQNDGGNDPNRYEIGINIDNINTSAQSNQ